LFVVTIFLEEEQAKRKLQNMSTIGRVGCRRFIK
jgi:hypothetical protein